MTGPRQSARRRYVATALLPVVSLVVALLLSEAALRLLALGGNPFAREVAAWDPFAVKVEPFGAYGYRQRPDARLHYRNGTLATANRQGFRGPDVPVAKPAGTFRIILLGGSSTHGFDVNDDQTIDHYMRVDLRAARPDLHVDVVNLAYDGYDAYQLWQRLLVDGVPLRPDLIVVNSGVNDVRNALFSHLEDPDPRTLIWEGELRQQRALEAHGGPTLWTWAKHLFYVARLRGVVYDILAARREVRLERSHPEPYLDAARNFALNINRIADIAHHLGIPLLLSTPPSALLLPGAPKTSDRGYMLATPEMTQAYRDTLAVRLTAIAAARTKEGQPVRYVSFQLPVPEFLDDVHLKPCGNKALAADFVQAIAPYLPPRR